MAERLRGTAAAEALFDSLPEATRQEAGRTLADIGKDALGVQQRQAPVKSGLLKSDLAIQLLLANLRVRVGLFNLSKGKGRPFYGPIVYYGRKAGETQRITKSGREAWRKLIREGKARRSRRPLGTEVTVRVGAMPANPFLDLSDADQSAIDGRLANFWSRVFANAGGAA